ncbi:ATP-binding protein [Roseovarius nubinhibens]|uniref:histidine kinase n=1 Tax=Roseovarius nubinhibens (strain ATCC BAA-591 / DSM 15170 / ISM) TaxID=89187 RepID=A3SIQ3_ROSNI|nr:HAMP domain-containing sensor histidine kinase [Roseovarius nubinhibens]EAP77234.1 sensor histidine kinase [Roseovarius nubinhibens ISM]
MLNSLSGRFLILTTIFVMLAEILIFVPSVARFREDYLLSRLERSQIASLALLANDAIDEDLQEELLQNAGVYNIVLRRNEARQLILDAPVPAPISKTFDMRDPSAMVLIRDALMRLAKPEPEVIRVIGEPLHMAGLLIEVAMDTGELRMAMIDYGLRILILSAVISVITAMMLFFAVRRFIVKPIKRVVSSMKTYSQAPEDVRGVITPSAGVIELREAEETLQVMQVQLTQSLRQKERLAQLGGAVAKVSHDLRNILTSAQLFTDRIEMSEDPTVRRLAPKLVNSITRAVHLCESTLAFGKAEEPAPRLTMLRLADLVEDVMLGERLALGADEPIELREIVPPTLELRADAEQLHRVLSNLVRNARQAMSAEGIAGEVRIEAQEDDHAWFLRVCDTGPGLPEKARTHLFTPFQGGTRKGGTGLGLSISSELIRGHGGTLELERSDAEGTIFLITLPKGALAPV